MLKTEHMALLAALNDDRRYRQGNACDRLRQLPGESVTDLFDEYIRNLHDSGIFSQVTPILELVARRGLEEVSLRNYLHLIQTYLDRDVRILTFWDDAYPQSLQDIPDPPLIMYVRGRVFPGADRIAVVGTRLASERGMELSRRFGRELAEKGHTIVSGLAAGIDAAAHAGAMEGGGVTLAVLGGHVDHVYPKENDRLFAKIVENGSIVSEITPQAEIRKGRFVERNRIISGLSEAVVIIETGTSGGTIRQVEYARAQRRPVYVVDHNGFDRSESEEGFRRLVESGAIPIRQPAELSELVAH